MIDRRTTKAPIRAQLRNQAIGFFLDHRAAFRAPGSEPRSVKDDDVVAVASQRDAKALFNGMWLHADSSSKARVRFANDGDYRKW
jgi:hypothetical protein